MAGDRGFESWSLQRGVRCELDTITPVVIDPPAREARSTGYGELYTRPVSCSTSWCNAAATSRLPLIGKFCRWPSPTGTARAAVPDTSAERSPP